MSSSSSSSSSSIGNLQTSNLLRLTGTNLMSGLDTDSIIKALVSGTQSKIDKQKQLEQIAEWKQSMYQDVTTSLKNLSLTYFSYSNSSTNLLSSTFFNSSALTSSSAAVSATGKISDAKAMVINSISQLASAASCTSTQQVSDEAITSGTIYSSWAKSNVGGQSVVVSYGGKDYTLRMGGDVNLNSEDQTPPGSGVISDSEVQKVINGLNDQINANSDLKGKISFSFNTGTQKIELTAADNTTGVGIKANSADSNSAAFLSALGFPGTQTSTSSVTAGAIDKNVSSSSLFSHTISGSSQFTLNYGGESYTLKLGKDVDITGLSASDAVTKIAAQLNTQIASTTGLSGNITFAASDSDPGKIELKNTGTQELSITDGSKNLLNGLGLTADSSAKEPGGGAFTGTDTDLGKLSYTYLGDALKGSTLTFNLGGLSKTVTFGTDETKYDTPSELASYLQSAVNNSFGSGKISISIDNTNKLSMKVADPTNTLTLTSSDSTNVLDKNGALRISYGDSNRISTRETLEDISGDFNQSLIAGSDGKYSMTINGVSLSFDKTDTVGEIISQINDSAAGVTVSYSQTTDSFRIVSSDTGSQGQVSISDDVSGGNLAQVLFGFGTSNLSAAKTGSLPTNLAGAVTSTGSSSYTFQLGTDGEQTISLGTSYNSISDLAAAVQTQIDGNSSLKGKISVEIDGDHLNFNAVGGDGTTILNIKSTGTGDILNVGSSGISTKSSSSTLAALYAAGTAGITYDSTARKYYVNGSKTAYDGTAYLSSVGQTVTAGTDLVMSVNLNGSSTPTTITRSSNSFTLDGVTITANSKTADNTNITFSDSSGTDDLYKKITDFVSAYNAIIAKANTYTTDTPTKDSDTGKKYAPLTDDQKKDMTSDEISDWNTAAKKGLLQNDSTLTGLLYDLAGVASTTETSSSLSLSDIGISTDIYDYTSGVKLNKNHSTLKSALATEPDKVQEMFTNATDGISAQLKQVLDRYVGTSAGATGQLIALAGTSGSTVNDTSAIGVQIKQYDSNITNLKTQLTTQEDRWWTKFTNMETSLAQLNSQMGYLSSMTGNSSSSS